jgi:hypothetical protein
LRKVGEPCALHGGYQKWKGGKEEEVKTH